MRLQPHMAKILMTAIVADIRNKLNGTVFSKNRYGAYCRTKVTPTNPQSPAQVEQRGRFAANAQAWRGLTETQRASWAVAAPNFPVTDIFGSPKILSASALYSKLNGNLATVDIAAIATAPGLVSVPSIGLVDMSANATANTILLNATSSVVPANFSLVIRTTGIIGAGQSFVKNKFRIVHVLEAGDSTNFNFTNSFTAKFGALVAGTKIFAEAYLVSNASGQAGIPQQVSTIVGA